MPTEPDWTILKLLKWTESYFDSHAIDSPRMTAEILLAHALKTERINLYLQHDKPLSSSELTEYKALIKRRIRREPVAYITGSREFWSIDLDVTRDVLIPRPDTETIVEAVLALLPAQPVKPPKWIVDLGTGSGAIIIALASERPGNRYFAADRSMPAARLASRNARKNKQHENICFFCTDWLTAFKPEPIFDIIVSNPPYIPTDVIPTLEPEIFQYEPQTALDGDRDGLSEIRKLIHTAQVFLKPDGYLLLEIGSDQMTPVSAIAENSKAYRRIDFIRDYAGHNRVVKLKKS